MGCSICLDDFNQADGEAKRASALRCGHIFHHDCLSTWFYGPAAAATHRPNVQHKRCPLCAAPAMPDAIFKLYPSDGDDLDVYLTGQKQWEWAGLDQAPGEEDRKWYKQLLEDLIDFNSTVQTYIMATHGVDCVRMIKSGVKIRKLVLDLTKDRAVDLNDSLIKAMSSLEDAAESFRAKFHDLQRKCNKNRQLQAELVRKGAEADEKLEAARDAENVARGLHLQADRKEREAKHRMDAALDLEQKLLISRRELNEQQAELHEEKTRLLTQQRNATLEMQIKLANMKSTNEEVLAEMRQKLEAANKNAAAAEEARKADHNKSCYFAEQMEKMKQQMEKMKKLLKDQKKEAATSPKSTFTGDNEAKDRRIRALEAENKRKDELLKAAGILTTPERRINRNLNRITPDAFVDLTRSSSPADHEFDNVLRTPLDGFGLPSQTSTLALNSPTTQRKDKGKKRSRASLSVEPEKLEDETDDELFPMPGLMIPKRNGPSAQKAPKSHLGSARFFERESTDDDIDLIRKPSTSATSKKAPLAPRVAPQLSASTTASVLLKSSSHKAAKANKKRKRANSTSSVSTVVVSVGSGSTTSSSSIKTAGPSGSNQAATSSSYAQKKKEEDDLKKYPFVAKKNGVVKGPSHKVKAQ